MTTQQIIDLARLKLLESEDGIITDDTILIYANLTYRDIIKKAFPNNSISQATVSFSNGVGSLPADFGTLYTDAYDTQRNIFPEVSISDFIRKQANSENAICVEGGEFKVSPVDTSSLIIKYYPTYETLAVGTDPTIDEYLHEPIVYGVLYRAFEDLQDPELSKYYKNEYKAMLDDYISSLSNYEEDAQRGGVMFNGISIINSPRFNDPNHF